MITPITTSTPLPSCPTCGHKTVKQETATHYPPDAAPGTIVLNTFCSRLICPHCHTATAWHIGWGDDMQEWKNFGQGKPST